MAPEVTIYDRSHLEIGDRVLFGSRVLLSSHIVMKRLRKYTVHVSPITIGDDVFLGFETSVGPGSVIEAGARTEVKSLLLPYTKVKEGEVYART